jgi:hypothetical protein
MTIKKITKNLILGTILLFLSTISAYAGFGVSPTDFNHQYLKPGLTFEKEFILSRSDSLEEMDISIQPSFEGIDSWFTYTPSQNFKFKRGQKTTTFKIKVEVPEDADYKDYNGVFRVLAVPSNQDVKGISITQGIRLDSGLVVTEVNVTLLSITSIKALDSELGKPIQIQITGENQGNVEVSPTLKVKIMDLNMNVLEEHEIADFGTIKPNQTSQLTAEFDTNLPSGEYFIEVTALLDGVELRTERLVFLINNIPEEKTEEKESGFGMLNSILADVKENLPYILIAVIFLIAIYYLLEKMWRMKDLRQKTEKWWAILLGSKKYSRMVLSFILALQIMLILILYPLLSLKHEGYEFEDGETQGAQDSKLEYPTLNVFPSIEVKGYLLYESPNTNSKSIYTAGEDERFEVEEESGDWYKVLLKDGTYGWLQKSIIKAIEKKSE